MRNLLAIVMLLTATAACGSKDKSAGDDKSGSGGGKPATTGELYPAIQPSSSKWGYIDSNGAWVIQPTYWAAGYFSEHRAGVKLDPTKYEYGFIDETGKLVLPAVYSYNADRGFPEFSGGFARVQRNSDMADVIIDINGKVTFTADKSGSLGSPSEGAFQYCLNVLDKEKHTCGHIDGNGKPVTPQMPSLNQIADFSDGLAMITSPEMKRGFIDKTGKVVIPMTLDAATEFGSGRSLVDPGDKKCVYYDKTGKVAIPGPFDCDKSGPFIDGLASATTIDGKSSCIDPSGKVVGTKCLRLHDGVALENVEYNEAKFVDGTGAVKFKIKMTGKTYANNFFTPFKHGAWRFDEMGERDIINNIYVSPTGEFFSAGMATKK
jgi:hypothetical protein